MTKKTENKPARATKNHSGKHVKPSIAFRPEPLELDAITRAALAARVTRNDWLRQAALEKLEREEKKAQRRI